MRNRLRTRIPVAAKHLFLNKSVYSRAASQRTGKNFKRVTRVRVRKA
jgi:hypothetical protein